MRILIAAFLLNILGLVLWAPAVSKAVQIGPYAGKSVQVMEDACQLGIQRACMDLARARMEKGALTYLAESCAGGTDKSCSVYYTHLAIHLGLGLLLGMVSALLMWFSRPREGQSHTYPGLKQSLLLLVAIVSLGASVSVVTMVLPGLRDLEPLHQMVLGSLVAWGVVLTVTYRYSSGRSLREVFGLKPVPAVYFPFLIALAVGSSILMSELDNVIRSMVPLPNWLPEEIMERRFMAFFFAVLLGPLAEEFFFRGLVLRGLLSQRGPRAAVFVSAALFAVVHLNPSQILPAFVLGSVFGWVALHSASIIPTVFMHVFINGLTWLIAGSSSFEIEGYNTPPEDGVFQPLWFDAIGALCMGIGLWGMRRFFLLKKNRPDDVMKPDFRGRNGTGTGTGTGTGDYRESA